MARKLPRMVGSVAVVARIHPHRLWTQRQGSRKDGTMTAVELAYGSHRAGYAMVKLL